MSALVRRSITCYYHHQYHCFVSFFLLFKKMVNKFLTKLCEGFWVVNSIWWLSGLICEVCIIILGLSRLKNKALVVLQIMFTSKL